MIPSTACTSSDACGGSRSLVASDPGRALPVLLPVRWAILEGEARCVSGDERRSTTDSTPSKAARDRRQVDDIQADPSPLGLPSVSPHTMRRDLSSSFLFAIGRHARHVDDRLGLVIHFQALRNLRQILVLRAAVHMHAAIALRLRRPQWAGTAAWRGNRHDHLELSSPHTDRGMRRCGN